MAGGVLFRDGVGDIGWLENGLRECSQKGCLQIILGLLSMPGLEVPGDQPRENERKVGAVKRTLHTIFGQGLIARNWYKSPEGDGRFPLDEALGLVDGHTPMLAGLVCRCSSSSPFGQAARDLAAYTGLEIEVASSSAWPRAWGPWSNLSCALPMVRQPKLHRGFMS